MHIGLLELKAMVPNDHGKTKTKNNPSQPDKNEEVNQVKEEQKMNNIEVKDEHVKENQVNDDVNVKTDNIDQKDNKTDNEDEQNVKIDVTSCSPGCVKLLNLNNK